VDFFFGDVASVFGAEQVLEQDAKGEREMNGGDSCFIERVEAVDFVFFVANFEISAAIEAILGHDGLPLGKLGRAGDVWGADDNLPV